MRIHTTAKLSEHIERTPEGYLFCPGVAVARTGVMRYLPEEVAPEICEGFDGDEVFIRRDASEVFCPRTLASFEGKPLTLDHPDEDVSPENWSELARGLLFNVRRGDPERGEANDLMLADILITDAEAIEAVNDGLRELSCGYDADFEVIRPGVGRQINILGNHVALVDHGRAGGRCKIKDRENPMAEKKNGKPGWADRLRRLLRDAEAEEAKGAQDEDNPPARDEEQPLAATDDDLAASLEEIKLMLRTLVEGLKPQQKADEEPARDEDGPACDEDPAPDEDAPSRDEDPAYGEDEPRNKTTDRKPRRMADADTVRNAQRMGLLGCRVGDSADAVRRSALALACRDEETRRVVDGILGKRPLARAGAAEVRAAFMAVSALTAAGNNRRTTDSLSRPGAGGARKPFTPADINRMNAEFYKGGK